MVERLWRSVKYEEIYVWGYAVGTEAWQGLSRYFSFYNTGRRHQGLAENHRRKFTSGAFEGKPILGILAPVTS